MTLRERFKQWLDTNPREQIREIPLEIIADDYAIEYGEWLFEHYNVISCYDREELLKIYKKEKGL